MILGVSARNHGFRLHSRSSFLPYLPFLNGKSRLIVVRHLTSSPLSFSFLLSFFIFPFDFRLYRYLVFIIVTPSKLYD